MYSIICRLIRAWIEIIVTHEGVREYEQKDAPTVLGSCVGQIS